MVHVECINEWRRSSENPSSYYQCDMCKYEYNIQRTHFAEAMQSYHVAQVVSVLLCVLLVAGSGCVFWTAGLHTRFYDFCWRPPWHDPRSHWLWHTLQRPFDHLAAGAIGIGVLGFAWDAYESYQRQDYNRIYGVMFSVASGANKRLLRWLVFIGLVMTFKSISEMTKQWSLRLLHKWGEFILEVRTDVPGPTHVD